MHRYRSRCLLFFLRRTIFIILVAVSYYRLNIIHTINATDRELKMRGIQNKYLISLICRC